LRLISALALLSCAPEAVDSGVQPARLISLSPALTDTVIALGAGAELVGISAYCSAPNGAEPVRLGVQDAPIEAITALRPSLVLVSDSRHGPSEILRRAGLPVRRFGEKGLAEILANTRRVGAAIGRPQAAEKLAASIHNRLAALAPKPGAKRPRVLLVFATSGSPLHTVWAAGPSGWMGDLLRAVGLDNALTKGPSYAQLSAEGILTLAPEMIVEVVGSGADNAVGMTARWAHLSNLPAVRHRRLHRLRGAALLRPGPRLIELAERLAVLR
jgi:iron complex transport system substrate-binding protein